MKHIDIHLSLKADAGIYHLKGYYKNIKIWEGHYLITI